MKYLSLVFAILFCTSSAFANTANLNGASYAISLHSTSYWYEGNLLEWYFTTYDGDRYAIPLYDEDDEYWYFSQELKKDGTLYKTDYFMIANGILDDYGEIFLDLASPDSNSNGIDDVCEKSMSFNKSISGNWYSAFGTSGGITGSMSKSVNSQQGTYIMNVFNTFIGNITVSGNYYVGTVSGTLNYSKKSANITVTYTSTWASQSSEEIYETTYDILDEDTIRINAVESFPEAVFTRSGNTYTAVVVLTDGAPETSWPDYQKWLITIQDSNDADGDGIPDLSDPVTPKAMPWIPLLLLGE